MSKTSIEVEGLDELLAEFNRLGSTLDMEGRKLLRDLSIWGVKEEQRNLLNVGAVDTNELIQGIHYDISGSGTSLQSVIKPSEKADNYAGVIEYGSAPHFPPIAALQGWADRHNIPVWLVAQKIAREGTEGRPTWQPTFEALDQETDRELPRFIDNLLRGL